jgi:nucleoside-diphosphate-sugar epimerase
MLNDQSILITGATGFVGRHLVSELVRKYSNITALVRKNSDVGFLQSLGVRLKYGDIKDIDSLRAAIEGVNIVIHLAALMSDKDYLVYKEFYNVNVKGSLNLASVFSGNGKQFIYVSTIGVYGATSKEGVGEDCNYGQVLSKYERSKSEAEKTLIDFCNNKKLAFTILRLGLLYGPGMQYGLPQVIRNIEEGRMFIFGKGDRLLHLTHVKDAINGIMLSVSNEKSYNQIFNICGGKVCLVKDVFYEIATQLKKPFPKAFPFFPVYLLAKFLEVFPNKIKPRRLKYLDTHRLSFFHSHHVYKIDKANRYLGYIPSIDLSLGITELVDWYQRNKRGD